ncbi:MAG TPA: phosphodiester glycosidase family protein [Chthoniobacterales bacterium]
MTAAQGAWRAAAQADAADVSGNVHFRKLTLENGRTTVKLLLAFGDATGLRCEIAAQVPQPFTSVREAVERTQGAAGVNGGYFQPDGQAVGWLVANGVTLHRWERARLLSGVFWVQNGTPHLQRSDGQPFSFKVEGAVQSGPFLVDHATPVSGLEATRSAPRTFLYMSRQGRFGIGSAWSATLAETASLLAGLELSPGDRLDRCLNLDGGSSTAFFARTPDPGFDAPGWARLNNCVVIAARGK